MQVADLFARLGLKVDEAKFNKGLAQVNAVRLGLIALGTYAAGKFVGSFIHATNEVIDFGDAVEDLQMRTGQSSEFLQKLAFAAGGGAEGLGKAQGILDKFGVKLREGIENPANDTAKALKELGISMDDPRVRLGNLEQLLGDVANQFEEMPNGAKKNELAFALMGKSGFEATKILTEYNEKARVAQRAGAILTDEERAKLAATKDQLEEISLQWQAVKQRAVMDALPTILKWLDRVQGWVKKYGPEIRAGLVKVFEVVAEKFEMLRKVVLDNKVFFEAAWKVVKIAIAAVGVAINVVIAAAGALMKTFEVVGTAIGEAIGWAVVKFKEFGAWISRVKTMFTEGFSKAGDTLSKAATDLVDLVKKPFVVAFEAIEKVWDTIVGKIEAAYNKVKGWVDEITDAYDTISGNREDRQKATIAAQDRKRSAEMARTLLGRGLSQEEVTAKVSSVYGQGVAQQAIREATKTVTVNAAPITVNISGVNETPENIGLMFQRKLQEAQGVMLRDAAATLGGGV